MSVGTKWCLRFPSNPNSRIPQFTHSQRAEPSVAGSELLHRLYPLNPLGRAQPVPSGAVWEAKDDSLAGKHCLEYPRHPLFPLLLSCALLTPPVLCFVSVYCQAFPLQSTAAWQYQVSRQVRGTKDTIHSQERIYSAETPFLLSVQLLVHLSSIFLPLGT